MLKRVPKGHVAWQSGTVIHEGEWVFGEARFFRLQEHVEVLRTKRYSFIVRWKPDPDNLQALIDHGDEGGVARQLTAILEADPWIDISQFSDVLGVIFTLINRPERANEEEDHFVLGRSA